MRRSVLITILNFLCFSFIYGQDNFTINIDFGNVESTLPWNNIINPQIGTLNSLVSDQGVSFPITVTVHDAFNGINNSGSAFPDPAIAMPGTATGDSFYGNNVTFAGGLEPTGGIKIIGLDPNKLYDLSIFASRIASDNRETEYTITGSSSEVHYLQVSNNVSDLVVLNQISPDLQGEIEIIATTGPNNNNTNGFFYLGAIRLEFQDSLAIPDPSLDIVYPNGSEYWQSNRSPEIRWESQGIDSVLLEYSSDLGTNWDIIGQVSGFTGRYQWNVPSVQSKDCLVRISADTLSVESAANFEITNTDTTSCHIVVLGSSTAAGTGPTSLDSAWVWRVEDVLFQNDTRFDVTNLARGGYTTYNLLPDDATIPAGVNQTIDSTRNITAALSLDPDAIIINLPSNDAANAYPVADQLANYNLMLETPIMDSIPHWICTPQPRNNFSALQIGIQEDLRDSTYAIFGNFAIDFWTEIASNTAEINPDYNSGDGVHLNNAGHKILADRVLAAQINEYLLDAKSTNSSSTHLFKNDELKVFPNPSGGSFRIKEINTPFKLTVMDSNGKPLIKQKEYFSKEILWEGKGLFYLIIEEGNNKYLSKVLKL